MCLNRSKTSDCRDASEERFFGLNRIKTSPLGMGWRTRGGKGCCLKVCLKLQTCGGPAPEALCLSRRERGVSGLQRAAGWAQLGAAPRREGRAEPL